MRDNTPTANESIASEAAKIQFNSINGGVMTSSRFRIQDGVGQR